MKYIFLFLLVHFFLLATCVLHAQEGKNLIEDILYSKFWNETLKELEQDCDSILFKIKYDTDAPSVKQWRSDNFVLRKDNNFYLEMYFGDTPLKKYVADAPGQIKIKKMSDPHGRYQWIEMVKFGIQIRLSTVCRLHYKIVKQSDGEKRKLIE